MRRVEELTVVESATDFEDNASSFLFGVGFLGVSQEVGRDGIASGDVILVVVGGFHAKSTATKFLN